MSVSKPGVSASFEVAFAGNLLERLYKDKDHKLTHAENLQALVNDSTVAQLATAALNTPGLLTTDAEKHAAKITKKLYDKKTNFDLLFENIFASDKNGVNICDVRNKFGQDIDTKVLGGNTLDKLIATGDAIAKAGKTDTKKAFDFWVHGVASHMDLQIGPDGKRINQTADVPNVDPKTGAPLETEAQVEARSAAAAAAAPPIDALTKDLPSIAAFRKELDRQIQGKMDVIFVNEDLEGHHDRGDFINNTLVGTMGASSIKPAADYNWTLSANASALKSAFNDVSGGKTLMSRQVGADYFNNLVASNNDVTILKIVNTEPQSEDKIKQEIRDQIAAYDHANNISDSKGSINTQYNDIWNAGGVHWNQSGQTQTVTLDTSAIAKFGADRYTQDWAQHNKSGWLAAG